MAFVFLAKRRLELGDQRLVSGIVVKLIARRQDELFECYGLALAVDGTRHAPIPPRRMVASSANSIVKRRR